jgi:hypothetical protein
MNRAIFLVLASITIVLPANAQRRFSQSEGYKNCVYHHQKYKMNVDWNNPDSKAEAEHRAHLQCK